MSIRPRLTPGTPLTTEQARAAGHVLSALGKVQTILGDEVWRGSVAGMTEPAFLPAVAVNHLTSALNQTEKLLDKDTIRRIVRENVPWLFEEAA